MTPSSGPRRLSLRRFGAIVLLAAALPVVLSAAAGARAQSQSTIDVVEISGVVDRTVAGYLADAIAKAERDGSDVLVIQLDTPGGLGVDPQRLVGPVTASRVPVAVWVGPPGAQAAGAGTLLAYAAHVLALAPAATLGPATPVDLGAPEGAAAADELVRLAALRGRSARFARAAGGSGAAVVSPDGARPGPRDAEVAGAVQILSPREVVERGVAELVAPSLPEVLAQLDGRAVTVAGDQARVLAVDEERANVRFHSPGLIRRVLHTVTSPTLAYLLVIGGALAMLFEVFQPGFGVAGVSGGAASALGLYGLWVLPVNWLAFGLLVLGLLLLAADLAIGRLGALTAGGTAALAVGSAWLFRGPDILRLPGWLIAAVVAATVVFFVAVMTTVLRAQRAPAAADAAGLVGKVGVVRSVLNPQGHVFVSGALWRARAPETAGTVRTGTPVRVVGVDEESTLDVELVDADESSPVA